MSGAKPRATSSRITPIWDHPRAAPALSAIPTFGFVPGRVTAAPPDAVRPNAKRQRSGLWTMVCSLHLMRKQEEDRKFDGLRDR